MPTISVDEIIPGITISKDIIDRNGRMILKKGSIITEKNLQALKKWGIFEVYVVEDSEKKQTDFEKNSQDLPYYRKAYEIIQKKFCHVDLNFEPAKELFKICIIKKAKELQDIKPEGKQNENILNDKIAGNIQISSIKKCPIDRNKLIKLAIELPLLPSIFYQLLETINDPRASAKKIAEVVNKDTSLSARLLQLINSAYFGLKTKIYKLSDAIMMLGTQQITSLAMGVNIVSYFKNIPNNLIDMRSFWEHSICCSIIAQILGNYKNYPSVELFLVGGLLHDIGRLISYKYFPEAMNEALLICRQQNSLLNNVELHSMGVNHAMIGKIVLKRWNIPANLENIG